MVDVLVDHTLKPLRVLRTAAILPTGRFQPRYEGLRQSYLQRLEVLAAARETQVRPSARQTEPRGGNARPPDSVPRTWPPMQEQPRR